MSRHPEKRVIVIVEDSAPLAALIKETLNAEPEYQALEVHDGETALEIIHAIQANAVILDVGLPGRSGLQIYDALRADARTRDLPVLFVTAQVEPSAFVERGIMHVIPKPFDLDVLLNHVDRLCGIDRVPATADGAPLPPPEYAAETGTGTVLLDAGKHDLDTIMDFLTGGVEPT
jgi:DNA-binding response OmpR family regulator